MKTHTIEKPDFEVKDTFILHKGDFTLLDVVPDAKLGKLFRLLLKWQSGKNGDAIRVEDWCEDIYLRIVQGFMNDELKYKEQCFKNFINSIKSLRDREKYDYLLKPENEALLKVIFEHRNEGKISELVERYKGGERLATAEPSPSDRLATAHPSPSDGRAHYDSDSHSHYDSDSIKKEEGIVYPFRSSSFVSLAEMLLASPKWKTQPLGLKQREFDKLKDFEEDFAASLVESAIRGNWSGLVFPETSAKYAEHLQRKRQSEGKMLTTLDDYCDGN